MTIDHAIAVITDFAIIHRSLDAQTLEKASKLGIEALKRVKAGRPKPPSLAFLPLPGETAS